MAKKKSKKLLNKIVGIISVLFLIALYSTINKFIFKDNPITALISTGLLLFILYALGVIKEKKFLFWK